VISDATTTNNQTCYCGKSMIPEVAWPSIDSVDLSHSLSK